MSFFSQLQRRWRDVKGRKANGVFPGICGGWISKSSAGLAGSLFVGGAIKVGLAVGWLLFPMEEVKEEVAKGEKIKAEA